MASIRVCNASDVPAGALHKVSADGQDIVLANIDGKVCAMSDTCTHAGASLSEGKIDGGILVCGWHGAQFECASGKLAKFPAKINDLKSYDVLVKDDGIFVEV